MQYENGNFKAILTPGRYAFWKGVTEYSFVKADLSKFEITEKIADKINSISLTGDNQVLDQLKEIFSTSK